MDYNLNIKNIKEYILEIYIYIEYINIYIYMFFLLLVEVFLLVLGFNYVVGCIARIGARAA